ncbi:SdrD B-like domain-containing protein [Spartinivicinus ruber]|uniref:SdrD B-like domain-containing protein n=1 Tax=Spartinivicinus ruber TaxID=2683272 RepID=UPI0013D168EF|nr:SdrD B-like domain-containing protein [Spartinivicinus ruber]
MAKNIYALPIFIGMLSAPYSLLSSAETTSSIGDRVWADRNANGIQETGEAGVEGVAVELVQCELEGAVASTFTDGEGYYSFNNIEAGSYKIVFKPSQGEFVTEQNRIKPNIQKVELKITVRQDWGSRSYQGTAKGIFELIDKSGNVVASKTWEKTRNTGNSYLDNNNETITLAGQGEGLTLRIRDNGSSGSTWGDDWSVKSLLLNDKKVDQVIHWKEMGVEVDSNIIAYGAYTRTGFTFNYAGKKTLSSSAITIPLGDDEGSLENSDNDHLNSDVISESGETACFNLQANEHKKDIDAALLVETEVPEEGDGISIIGDTVFNDTNGNGQQDGTETGIENVTVNLFYPDNTLALTTKTDKNGNYRFELTSPGCYKVDAVKPDNYEFTLPQTGSFSNICLSGGDERDDIDFGLKKKPENVCLELKGPTTIWEGGSGSYQLVTSTPSEKDAYYQVRFSNGSARFVGNQPGKERQDIMWGGYYTVTQKTCWWIFCNERKWNVYNRVPNGTYTTSNRPMVGPKDATWDFSVFDKGRYSNTNTVQVKIPAGSTTSPIIRVNAWRERITIDNEIHNRNSGREGRETFYASVINPPKNNSCKTQTTVGINDSPYITAVSPIGLDLNNDGKIGVTGDSTKKLKTNGIIGKTVQFDIDSDGALETIEWFAGDGDGILVDNKDGKASTNMNGSRLYGDDNGRYQHGFNKLALLDKNKDGRLTGDELIGIQLWVDNGNAIVDEGELKDLVHYDIIAISVEMSPADGYMRSTALTSEGKNIMTEDVWFKMSKENTQ